MISELDGLEQSARIVEAFASGQSSDVAAHLASIAQAIRSQAPTADGFERAAHIVEGSMTDPSADMIDIVTEISKAIREHAIDN